MSSWPIRALAVSFLSTPSARRATGKLVVYDEAYMISIHALREEGDEPCRALRPPQKHFYPRPPRGGRPEGIVPLDVGQDISIHALREEGDPAGISA